jgi:hypothetical protein
MSIPPPSGPTPAPQGTTRVALERNAIGARNAFHRMWRIIRPSQLHTDTMLSWLIAAVAVAIYATPTLLTAFCGAGHALPLGRLLLLWIITIPVAILARLVAKFHRDANDKYYLAKTIALKATLVDGSLTDTQLATRITEILSDKRADLNGRERLVRWAGRISDALYWGAYILAALGFLTLVRAGISCTPVAPIEL